MEGASSWMPEDVAAVLLQDGPACRTLLSRPREGEVLAPLFVDKWGRTAAAFAQQHGLRFRLGELEQGLRSGGGVPLSLIAVIAALRADGTLSTTKVGRREERKKKVALSVLWAEEICLGLSVGNARPAASCGAVANGARDRCIGFGFY
jgi:hypothetical protein